MTRRKRETSSEERALFQEIFREISAPPAPKKSPAAKMRSETAHKSPQAKSSQNRPVQPGIDGRTAERLRRGQLEPEARLDLHGMTEAVAHRSLTQFIRSAQAQSLRLVLVVTGKGVAAASDAPYDMELDRRSRGVLKAMTPRWLKERSLAPFVAEVRSAHRRHGGGGALYVYLRKTKP